MNIAFKILVLVAFTFVNTVLFGQDADRAQDIINKAIEAHGGASYDNLAVGFKFRDKDYSIKLDNGSYEYTRTYKDSTGVIQDVLTNEGYERKVDGFLTALSEKDIRKHSNAINSVCYFALLPKGLNDPAVKKSMIGLNKIAGQKYHVVQVTFDQEGGGDDFEDKYVYWINQKSYTIDYLAYSFHVNGGGVRFRSAMDPVMVDGVRFQNYVNYKHADKDATLDSLPFYYVQNQLTKLSEILTENVKSLK